MIKDFIKPTLVLMVICLVVSSALVFAYGYTLPMIQENEKAAADMARTEVLPGCTGFEEILGSLPEAILQAHQDTGGNVGFVFKVKTKGYGGAMSVMVGISNEGLLTGVKLLDNKETPGLGSKVGLPAFTEQFKDKDKGLADVDMIAGSTISSKAFIAAVDSAFEAYEVVKNTLYFNF